MYNNYKYLYTYIEFGYISNVDVVLSEENSTVTITCHLACQTDFITGCNVTLINACGKEFTQLCTVDNTPTLSPRQCSIVFEDLLPSNYFYTATVQSNNPLQLEANILNMDGSFVNTSKFLDYSLCINYT